ncbi:hypothetical protein AF79_09165 [Aliarcobacter butzleri L354]|uniref:hypothetical protein n=1 Tax=Aliarcobacter butzleri TaxID=28197 RepID=UPI00063A9D24|nr:hypothetical protein [Aliarcobacter butzleri]KLE08121.1 hypothetical protein AF79_09165 [Aliarcobacter butzleri L354]
MNKFLIVDTNKEIFEMQAQLHIVEKFIDNFGEIGLSIYKKVENEQIVFSGTFIEKIRAGKKIFTVRNKPINLGIYEVTDSLKIEVIKSQKVEAYFHQYMGQKSISFNTVGDDIKSGMSINTKFGFDTQNQMVDFYKGYLKNSTAYLMQFRIVS